MELIAYQRRYVENGNRDDDSWGYTINTALFQNYEWRVVQGNVMEDARLKERLNRSVRTAFGGTGTQSTDQLGREFLEEAWTRISSGRLLVGDPGTVFEVVYSRVLPFLSSDTLAYEGATQLHNVRVETPIELDDRTIIRQLSGEERQHIRWRQAPWDDQWETCAALVRRYDLPVLGEDDVGDPSTIYAEQQAAAQDVLLAIAVAGRQRGTVGTTSIASAIWTPSPSFMSLASDYPHGNVRTVLHTADAEIVKKAWAALRKRERLVRLAAERIADVRRLADPGDAIIDTVTALEAVIGMDAERELPRRLSLYAARLCAPKIGIAQRQLYDSILEGFRRRQLALRGKQPPGQEQADDERLSVLIETVVRSLLQMRLERDPSFRRDMTEVLLTDPPSAQKA
jgi:hypothetical protein